MIISKTGDVGSSAAVFGLKASESTVVFGECGEKTKQCN